MKECRIAWWHSPLSRLMIQEGGKKGRPSAYSIIDDILSPRIIVNVNGDAAQGRDFSGELVQARVVLAFAFICFGHGERAASSV